MSVRIMSLVFEMSLPPSEKVVALALADHAHDDGTEARPGVRGLAVKTTLSERQVQRVIKALVEKGVLKVQREATNKMPVVYQFDVNMSPQDSHRGDTDDGLGVTPGASRGDTGVTQTINEPSEEPSSLLVVEKTKSSIENEFELFYEAYPRHVGRAAALVKYRLARRKGVLPITLLSAAINYATVRAGQDASYTMHPKTFLGPDEYWKEYLDGGVALFDASKRTRAQIKVDIDEAVRFILDLFNVSRETIAYPLENKLAEKVRQTISLKELGRMTPTEIQAIVSATAYE